MEADFAYMLGSAGDALGLLVQPERIIFLVLGVVAGLAIGLIPGIGGLTGFALLVPFTYTMDPYAAFAMLLGMLSVTTTSDTIPAVLFGVPGTAASQATVLDGLPMSQKGEASRALSASFTASLIGGLFGALVLAISIPVVRPFVLAVGTPELLALTVLGIAMVASLSGNTPLRGIVVACFGILIGMIGTDAQTGQLRWTGDVLYLWDGVPMLPVLLGIFALPELCDLAIKKSSLTKKLKFRYFEGMWRGIKDVAENWFLVLRCSALGTVLGAIPGISGSVIDWIAYGHALRSEKGASETFSKGDVRGVIAPESANNSSSGGQLVPTIAFGVPGSAAQAILLGALMIHGFVPGPSMLTTDLNMTYSLVWSVALANIFGAGLCFLLSGHFAKISMLRYTLVLPGVMVLVYIGAFQGSGRWGDMFVLLGFGALAWVMKRLRWPRPPLILGLVLGVLMERYMAISIMRYDATWLMRPGVVILLVLAAIVVLQPMIREIRHGGVKSLLPSGRPSFRAQDLLYYLFIGIGVAMLVTAQSWSFGARIGPTIACVTLIGAAVISYVHVAFSDRDPEVIAAKSSHRGIHMDLDSDDGEKPVRTIIVQAAIFFGWFIAFLISMAIIGLIPSIPLLIVAFMRVEGREPWRLSLTYAAVVTALVYIVFDQVIHVPWPSTLMGSLFPALGIIPSM